MHNQINHTRTSGSHPSIHAPYMVVNPGENLMEAAVRHRRDTGHKGSVIVVAFNRPLGEATRSRLAL